MKKKGEYSKIALFVDYPNMIGFELKDIYGAIGEYGKDKEDSVVLKKVYFKFHPTVSEKVMRQMRFADVKGFKSETRIYDIDKLLASGVTKLLCSENDIDLVAIAGSDSDYRDVLIDAKENGKDTLVLLGNGCPTLEKLVSHTESMKDYVKGKRELANEQGNSASGRKS